MIKSKDILNNEHIKFILDSLKPTEKYINTLNEDSFEYETLCEKVGDQLCEIDEYLFEKTLINDHYIILADIRIMLYWDYLQSKLSFTKLLNKLNDNK